MSAPPGRAGPPEAPQDVLTAAAALQRRLALRIAADSGGAPVMPEAAPWIEPQWESVAPGITVKLRAVDDERRMVSMLVRLAPGGSYPAHTHAAAEELHLMDG